jgi:hypothetical protein
MLLLLPPRGNAKRRRRRGCARGLCRRPKTLAMHAHCRRKMMLLLPPPPRGNAKRRRGRCIFLAVGPMRLRLLLPPQRRHVG